MRLNFKCDSCKNVTRRGRVTDDTPRSTKVAGKSMESNLPCDNTTESPPQENIVNMTGVIAMLNESMDVKLNIMESKIIDKIQNVLSILVTENSKLRQELNEANVRCVGFQEELNTLKTERNKRVIEPDILPSESGQVTVPYNAKTSSQLPISSPQTQVQASKGIACNSKPQPASQQPKIGYAAAVATTSVGARKPAETSTEVENRVGVADNRDTNNWIEVKNSKRINPVKRGGSNAVLKLKAVERKKLLHVWRLEKNTTEESLTEHIRNTIGNDAEIDVEKVIPKYERKYSSFKIRVTESNFEKLCVPEVWPVNVEFCEWIWFRRPTTSEQPKPQT